jgi:ribonuclease P protein component
MFPRKQRIPRSVLDNLFKQKKSVSGDFFVFKTFENNLKRKRFAVIVPKKIEKGATRRHLLKRQIINIIMETQRGLGEYKNADFLFFINKKTEDKNFKEKRQIFKDFVLNNKVLFFDKV